MNRKMVTGLLAATAVGTSAGLWWMRRPLATAWDIWRAGRATQAALAARQRERLGALVAFTRAHSAFYRALYRGLPAETADLHTLPVVTKPDLMAHLDDWVTDPQVTRTGVDAFVADPTTIGQRFLGRYTVWTTSGTTGRPGIFVHDPQAVQLYYTLGIVGSDSTGM